MSKFIITLLIVVFAFLGMVGARQERKITGTVTSADDKSVLPGVNVLVKGTKTGTVTDANGKYEIQASGTKPVLVFSYIGYVSREINVKDKSVIDVQLSPDIQSLQEVVVSGYSTVNHSRKAKQTLSGKAAGIYSHSTAPMAAPMEMEEREIYNTEEYDAVRETGFREALKNPLSTFSIDVDAASYSNMRRYLNQGQMPPKDAVRIEEMVNYFTYDYPQPQGSDPFSINTEISECPWNKEHRLVHIGLQGKEIPTENLPASNLVFLIDVSGSMNSPEKLPLLKSAFSMLTDQLRANDKVAIVVYAGAAGLVLPSTSGADKERIRTAISQLEAGGSTAGGEGIRLAYKIAKENFREGGNNRVILATDGDFNVGVSSNAEMERLIEEKRESGIFLTVLGFGMGNYKDSKMEILADKGNGNYSYIDNIMEARKVLVNEFGGTLFTIAKDVKMQIEFNPTKVKAYRLIGYENRMLQKEDFNNDKKDAGELGSGHTVTALYEIIPANSKEAISQTDELKYQKNKVDAIAYNSKELMTLKLRYKQPNGNESKLISTPVIDQDVLLSKTSNDFRFSAAVAEFGMLLRNSEFKGTSNYYNVVALAEGAKGKDKEGYRVEFINMVKSCQLVAGK
jgi:Ca-activated chloride channel family protein